MTVATVPPAGAGAPVADARRPVYEAGKRAFDIAASAIGLAVLSPMLALVSLRIRQESAGPILYRAPRVGRHGQPFLMYKFRTMVVDADRKGGSSTPDDDPRITGVGKTLRAYKLDELPQLLNVLRGDMSIVGPRPQVAWAVDLYTPVERRVLSVPPGITDYASLEFPNEGELLKGSTDPDRDYMEKIHPHKMALSLRYVEQRSFATDVAVILRTLLAIVKR